MLTNNDSFGSAAKLDAVFSALGDPTRRDIIARLSRGELTLSDLAAPYQMSQTAVTRHVTVLRDAGMVAVEKRSRTRHCRLDGHAIDQAVDWLSAYQKFWSDQFLALEEHLRSEKDT